MTIQSFFVHTDSFELLRELIVERLNTADDSPGLQPHWGLESAYDAFIVGDPKRKVGICRPENGWIAGIESKEVVDFALLQRIHNVLKSDVVVVQLSEITGSCGHVVLSNGRIVAARFDEDSADPLADARATIRSFGIPFDVMTFREVAQDRSRRWELIQKNCNGSGDRQWTSVK